ncbi:copper amine oxidase N-terminal domain-containing protein [Paenibacillus xerothermodurans]|uniref:Copper amine oxidase N-terminal domain-containing protein n=2 Tax=Paenibacillus xerothermodurans TaxID=1977292 RepID=A0A2W1NRT2_PAEXE|nr:copper amine oxidase N-terminal domain-containing protein [Paenibacillus xerothermodurans]
MAMQQSKPIDAYFVPLHYMVNEKEFAPTDGEAGLIYNGTTYVPLRFVSYILNKSVGWDGATYKVTVGEPKQEELAAVEDYKQKSEVKHGRREKIDAAWLQPTPIDVYFEKMIYQFGDVVKEPAADQQGFIYDDKLFVSMRFIAESLGLTIAWDPETYTVSITTGQPHESEQPTSGQPAAPAGTNTEQTTNTSAPNTAPVTGGSGGGGGGGGGKSRPSYQSLKNDADAQLESLRNKYAAQFLDLAAKYFAAPTTEEQDRLKNEGRKLLAESDRQFEATLSSFESRLKDNGYDTSIVAQYRQQYADEKQTQIDNLKNSQ